MSHVSTLCRIGGGCPFWLTVWCTYLCCIILARSGHASVVLPEGAVVLLGGLGGSGFSSFQDVWKSVNGGETWVLLTLNASWSSKLDSQYSGCRACSPVFTHSSISTLYCLGRYYHSAVVLLDGSILIIGGRSSSGLFFNDVWKSVDGGISWVSVSSNAEWPGKRFV